MAILNPFPRYGAFTDFTPTIPSFYWDTYSQEERIKALCKEYAKLVAFTDSMVDTVNSQYATIRDLQEHFPELVEEAMIPALEQWAEDGSLRRYIDEQLEEVRHTFTGATASAAGAPGMVPAPMPGDNTKFLSGAGTWEEVQGGGGGGGGVTVNVDGSRILASAGAIDFVGGENVTITGGAAGATARITINAEGGSPQGLAAVAYSGNYSDLEDKPTIPAAQVQANWNQTNSNAVDFIKNKPTIPAAQVQANWGQLNSSAVDFIKNKPAVDTEAAENSANLITSGGAFAAAQNVAKRLEIGPGVNVLCIGDSFLEGWTPEGTNASWGTLIGTFSGANVTSFPAGGAGFTTGAKTFANLVDEAHQGYSGTVDAIIIGGGFNDCMVWPKASISGTGAYSRNLDDMKETVAAAASALFNKIAGYWPNARIYMFPNLWANGNNATDKNSYGIECEAVAQIIGEMAALSNANVQCFQGCWTWIYGDPARNYSATDDKHPNADGQKIIARNMLASIAGRDCTITSQTYDVPNVGARWTRNGLVCTISFNGVDNGLTPFTLENFAAVQFAGALMGNNASGTTSNQALVLINGNRAQVYNYSAAAAYRNMYGQLTSNMQNGKWYAIS